MKQFTKNILSMHSVSIPDTWEYVISKLQVSIDNEYEVHKEKILEILQF